MLVLAILIFSLTVTHGEKTVKYAAVIYRHGDRTPVNLYPTDPWRNESLWPVKFGELTNVGKRQHYALGKWLRKRYLHLISEKFDPSEIYIRSTDVDRTLMSAQANLAGMYPPSGDSLWNAKLIWQPIPVHTIPYNDDEVLAMGKKCLPYNKEKEIHINSRPYKERLSKYQGLMDYLTAYTGKKIKDYLDINEIYNVLYIETLYNFTLPNWTQSVYPNRLREPACYSFSTSTATPLMARLMVGPLLKEIMTKMNTVILKKKPNPLKLSIYSAHDFQIGNILSAMGVFDGNCPAYTSTLFFELLQDNSTMEYFIQMLYRNSTEIIEPHILNIPHCGEICSIERFLKLYDNLVTVDWNYECTKQISPLIGACFFLGLFSLIYYIVHKIHFSTKTTKRRIQFTYSSVYNPTTAAVPEKNIEI